MSIRITELPKQEASVKFGKAESSRTYIARGDLSKSAIIVAVGSYSPVVDTVVDLDGNPLDLFRNDIKPREKGGGVWEVVVTYSNTPDQFDLRITNGIQGTKTLVAEETIRVYDTINGTIGSSGDFSTPNVPPLFNSINVTAQGVQGTEMEIGKWEFSITKKLKFATLDAAYEAYLKDVTPSVNVALWVFIWKSQVFAFPRGSVLFRGHTTNTNSDDDLELTHSFAYSHPRWPYPDAWSNASPYDIGDQVTHLGFVWRSTLAVNVIEPAITGNWDDMTTFTTAEVVKFGPFIYQAIDDNTGFQPDISPAHWDEIGLVGWLLMGVSSPFTVGASAPIEKEGWQFMWPWYRAGAANGMRVQVPTGVVIQRIYDYSDFDNLDVF